MEADAAFQNALRIHPQDDVTRAVYADWLEEHGDPRAEFLRLQLAVKSMPAEAELDARQHRLRILRMGLDPDWLKVVEPLALLGDLSLRAQRVVKRAKITTLGELCELTDIEVLSLGAGGFGEASWRELRDKLHAQGLQFRLPNVVKFRRVRMRHWYGLGVQILIDGHDLIDLVRGIESGVVAVTGDTASAGSYSGLPAESYLPPSRHFWGEEGKEWWNGKSELLTCGDCGEVGCWPLVCSIAVMPSRVIWSDFEQPHRTEADCGDGAWRYDGLGPLVFDRGQYEAALRCVAGEAEPCT